MKLVTKLLDPVCRRVIAFDRPAFGLTSRPPPQRGNLNPYSLDAQASLTLDLCVPLGVRSVILVAHGEGGLIGIKAAQLAGGAPGRASSSSSCSSCSSSGGGARPFVSDDAHPTARSDAAGPSSSCQHASGNIDTGGVHIVVGEGDEATGAAASAAAGQADNAAAAVSCQHELSGPAGAGPCSLVSNSVSNSADHGHGFQPKVLGLALLHPHFSASSTQAFMRLLSRTRMGRSMLRPLLRGEVSSVAARQAWCNPELVTVEVQVGGLQHSKMMLARLVPIGDEAAAIRHTALHHVASSC